MCKIKHEMCMCREELCEHVINQKVDTFSDTLEDLMVAMYEEGYKQAQHGQLHEVEDRPTEPEKEYPHSSRFSGGPMSLSW